MFKRKSIGPKKLIHLKVNQKYIIAIIYLSTKNYE